ncbi:MULTISPECIES: Nramp family divalent metal transporter [Gammaproteobacteria]|uniref:Nramp family divalent metal transporter n=1 Tax=Gammaproteobacteria TaxID=1236 RepID=UPI000DCFEA75|nr:MULTISPECIES: Nramp family divalent metal transporter [Gammaproteobacteria]RTE86278.1 divalent metal cation transporter [Aliidiomarina sp. B3213]TCZ91629.1 divalent metal cation transporter [Lysobacter sp. N42]
MKLGPATLVAAAFIGPGTVVTASLAGAQFGYALIWVLVCAIGATLILQEMAARVGVVTQQGLGENLRTLVTHPILRILFFILVIAAIVIGNAAYQGGNITGASIGVSALMPSPEIFETLQSNYNVNVWTLVIGTIAGVILWQGQYKRIEIALIALVALMSLAFLSTFILTGPDWLGLFKGFLPSAPSGSLYTLMALVGTTVVPYAIFLHADSARQRWHGQDTQHALKESNQDLWTSIPIGGLITLAILSTASTAFFAKGLTISGPADLATTIEPVFGDAAGILMGIGLFAAGISSAITAPLASAYALTGILGGQRSLNGRMFKLTWIGILITGVIIASLRIQPLTLITFAQIMNALLLPLIATFLLMAVNHNKLGKYKNTTTQNILGFVVVLFTLALSLRTFWFLFFR